MLCPLLMVTVRNLASWHLLPSSPALLAQKGVCTEHLGRRVGPGVESWPTHRSERHVHFLSLPSFRGAVPALPPRPVAFLVKKIPVTVSQSLRKEGWIKSLDGRKETENAA